MGMGVAGRGWELLVGKLAAGLGEVTSPGPIGLSLPPGTWKLLA